MASAELASPALSDALVILGAAGLVIPVFTRFRVTPIIGFILMPLLEQNLDQAVSIVGGDYLRMLASPIGWIFIGLSVLSVVSAIRSNRRGRRKAAALAAAE